MNVTTLLIIWLGSNYISNGNIQVGEVVGLLIMQQELRHH